MPQNEQFRGLTLPPDLAVIQKPQLPEGYQIPQQARDIIERALASAPEGFLDRIKSLPLHDDALHGIYSLYRAIEYHSETEGLSDEQADELFKLLPSVAPTENSKNLADQLIELRDVMFGFYEGTQAFQETMNEFISFHLLDLNNADSVFTSDIQFPAAQALAIRFMALANPEKLNTEENALKVLALRWFHSPDDEYYKVQELSGTLAMMANLANFQNEHKAELELYQAEFELEDSINDPKRSMTLQNKALAYAELGDPNKALIIMINAVLMGSRDDLPDEETTRMKANTYLLHYQISKLKKGEKIDLDFLMQRFNELQVTLEVQELENERFEVEAALLSLSHKLEIDDPDFEDVLIEIATEKLLDQWKLMNGAQLNEVIKALLQTAHPGVKEELIEIYNNAYQQNKEKFPKSNDSNSES